jgi:hypothetical protein
MKRGALIARPGWCVAHGDFGWRYTDGVDSCFFACIVETGSSECRVVPADLTVRGERRVLREAMLNELDGRP